MCYHCATNPSIHHHHCHVAAVSLLLSHHGVAFAVTLSQFCRCRHGVTFTSVAVLLLPSQCCLHCRIIVVLPSLSCHHSAFAVTLSQFRCCCHGFVIAITVSLSPSRFCCCCHGVAFIVALSWFC